MAELVSGLDAVYRRSHNSWQDTSAPPNQMIRHLGPGLVSLALQRYNDSANQAYHRDSMKGQIKDVPNLLFLFKTVFPQALTFKDFTLGETIHRESMKGQLPDPQNILLQYAIFNDFSQPRPMVINPVYKRRELVQDTQIQRNPLFDIIAPSLPPSRLSVFDDEGVSYHHDSLSGQYGRTGSMVSLGVPPAFNEIYTFVYRGKTAQEPYVHPNALILGVQPSLLPAAAKHADDLFPKANFKGQEPFTLPNLIAIQKPVTNPFVHPQSEDLQYRRPKVQETYTFPNVLLGNRAVPVVRHIWEDLQWRRPKVQETYVFPNVIITNITPNIVPPFIFNQYDHLNLRGHQTQPHYDFPNATFYGLNPNAPQVTVPNLIGLQYTVASGIIVADGFTQNIAPIIVQTSLFAPGIVFAQTPLPGTIALSGSNIQLTVAVPVTITLPNYVGLDWLTASRIIYFGGFVEIDPQVERVINQNLRGIVVGQNPPAFTQVLPGSTVQLTVGADHMLAVAFET